MKKEKELLLMKMKSTKEIYKEAIREAEKRKTKEEIYYEKIRVIKKLLENEIGNHRELFLAYKAKIKSSSIPEISNLFLSTVAFIVSIYTFLSDIIINIIAKQINSNNQDMIEKINASNQYILEVASVIILILIVVVIFVVTELNWITPYKTMEIVLDDIEKEMDKKEKDEEKEQSKFLKKLKTKGSFHRKNH